ncbi:hypothetical protein M0Q50_09880 [bacterium]|nr:hypothetical protein [bacterium]
MENWNKIEYIFVFKAHCPPSELERLEWYRIHYLLKEYEEDIKRQNDEVDKQNKDIEKQNKSMGNISAPKFETPKFQTPKINYPK